MESQHFYFRHAANIVYELGDDGTVVKMENLLDRVKSNVCSSWISVEIFDIRSVSKHGLKTKMFII